MSQTARSLQRRIFFGALMVTAMMVVMVGTLASTVRTAHAAKPEIDLTYANGTVVNMIGVHVITDPNLLAQAEELYLAAFPVDTSCAPNCGPITLPSGY